MNIVTSIDALTSVATFQSRVLDRSLVELAGAAKPDHRTIGKGGTEDSVTSTSCMVVSVALALERHVFASVQALDIPHFGLRRTA